MSEEKTALIFATQNKNKAFEIQGLLPDHIIVKTLQDIGCDDDIPEEQPDLKGNALQKARYVYEKFNVNCFADDTGLEIDALNGEPGVYSARYAGPEKDSNKNMDLVLEKLEGESNRKAQFRTVVALILDGKENVFEGKVTGEIRKEKSGAKGFGYDPIFEPENFGKTFAEMSLEEKNERSHRSRAIAALVDFFK
ncbi:non-canonical purine NTP diphosphatase [Brumimicrobium aurantiacum]|uniref:dITP/XTP pyrophosphatase n=1 Tax=Brumimicrobium aurantiacum TaxID=1737063 RepID=A0A3E1F1L3_9FLAO|nr:non-canonical purine NTP diphosphatase [Brumimicrobium aurantiacum]RFC55708.1 non-canonical purine NTP diphosphatase [Brumimicrobium aurantiacum]